MHGSIACFAGPKTVLRMTDFVGRRSIRSRSRHHGAADVQSNGIPSGCRCPSARDHQPEMKSGLSAGPNRASFRPNRRADFRPIHRGLRLHRLHHHFVMEPTRAVRFLCLQGHAASQSAASFPTAAGSILAASPEPYCGHRQRFLSEDATSRCAGTLARNRARNTCRLRCCSHDRQRHRPAAA